MTAGRVRLSTGTLYDALRTLLEEGSIRRFRENKQSLAQPAARLVEGP